MNTLVESIKKVNALPNSKQKQATLAEIIRILKGEGHVVN